MISPGAAAGHRLHGEVLRKIVLNGRYNRLHEFEKNDQIHMHAQFAATVLNGLDDLLHNLRVSVVLH